MKEVLLDIGDKLLNLASQSNIDQTEVYLESRRSKKLSVEAGSIKTAKHIVDQGIAVRTAIGNQLGFSYATSLSFEDCKEVLEKSATIARVNDEDPFFVEFPAESTLYPQVSGIYDKTISKITSDEISDLLFRAIQANQNHLLSEEVIIYGEIVVTTKSNAVINSNGIKVYNEGTRIALIIDSILRINGQQLDSFEAQYGTNLAHIDPEWVGQSAAENTLRMLHPKPVENKQMPIVLSPHALGSIFGMGLTSAVNAENYLLGQSYLNGLLDSEIASEQLQIVDDGILEGGYYSSPFDGEGSPSARTEVISGGVLKSLLHNSYTAKTSSFTNTGNAIRNSYPTFPSIGCTNLRILPGQGSLDELLSEMAEGIYCHLSLDRPNQLTGDINALIMEGFFVKNGEILHPVRNTIFGINMRDLLNRVVWIGDDIRVTDRIVSPSIMIDSVNIFSE